MSNKTTVSSIINLVKHSTLAKGTIFLTFTGLLTKFLGLYNRIFLSRLIGVSELGIYQLAFPIYVFSFSVCCQGLSTALTKHVAKHIGLKHEKKANSLLFFCCCLSFTLGIIIASVIRANSGYIALHILKNSNCAYIVKLMELALPAMCIKGCINAFFLGCSKPGLSGVSHLIEQIARITAMYLLAYYVCEGRCSATLAAAATVFGEYTATIIAVAMYIIYSNGRYKNYDSQENMDTKDISLLIADYIPITTNEVLSTLFSSFEAIILPSMLVKYYLDSSYVMELYGAVTGIVIPFLLFPATITTALSSMLLPSISKAVSSNRIELIKRELRLTVIICTVLGLVALLGYRILGMAMCTYIFDSTMAGILLQKMCILCPLIYLSGSMHTVLVGIGDAGKNLLYYIISISVRIIITIYIVPRYGIPAYIYGMLISYGLELYLIARRLYVVLFDRIIP